MEAAPSRIEGDAATSSDGATPGDAASDASPREGGTGIDVSFVKSGPA